MMLARFSRLDATFPAPKYEGRVPVFFVMADNEGGKAGNYHGTTVLTQTFRGLWPELCDAADRAEHPKTCSHLQHLAADPGRPGSRI